jgi:hypothetical protein
VLKVRERINTHRAGEMGHNQRVRPPQLKAAKSWALDEAGGDLII